MLKLLLVDDHELIRAGLKQVLHASLGDLTIGDVDISDVVTASIDSLVVSGTSNRLDPAAPNDTPQGRAKNRRVVMDIVEAK